MIELLIMWISGVAAGIGIGILIVQFIIYKLISTYMFNSNKKPWVKDILGFGDLSFFKEIIDSCKSTKQEDK